VTPRDAARLQKHLEDKIEETGARPGTSKIWDGYRQYEKKLLSTAARGLGGQGVAQDEGGRNAENPDDTDNEDQGEKTPTAVAAKRRASRREVDTTPTKSSARKRKHNEEEDDDIADVIDVAPISDEPSFDLGLEDEADAAAAVDQSLVLDLEGDEDGGMDSLEVELPNTADQRTPRSRSASLDPGVKRRKTTRKV